MPFPYGDVHVPCPFVDALIGEPWDMPGRSAFRVDPAIVDAAQSMRARASWLDASTFAHEPGMPRGSAWFYFGSTPMQRPTKTDERSTSRSGEINRGA